MNNLKFRLALMLTLCLSLSLILIACVGFVQPTTVTPTPTTVQYTPTTTPDTQQGVPASLQQIDTQDHTIVSNTALNKDMSALQADTRALATFTLTDLLGNYASGWNTMQEDYNKALNDSRLGCGNNNVNGFQVSNEVNKISDDQYKITSTDTQLTIKKDQYKALVAAVNRDEEMVKGDWRNIETSPTTTKSDVDKALAKGDSAKADTKEVWDSAVETASQYDNKAHTLKGKVDRIVPDMQCS